MALTHFKKVMEAIHTIGDVTLEQALENFDKNPKLKEIKNIRISKRIMLIAYAFAKGGYDSDALNELLSNNNCEQLYPRNVYDFTLIYVFDKYSSCQPYDYSAVYKKWIDITNNIVLPFFEEEAKKKDSFFKEVTPRNRNLYEYSCNAEYGKSSKKIRQIVKSDMNRSEITLNNMLVYIANVDTEIDEYGNEYSKKYTHALQEKLSDIKKASDITTDDNDLYDAIEENHANFALCRERARRYFVKYLCELIVEAINRCDLDMLSLFFKNNTKEKKDIPITSDKNIMHSDLFKKRIRFTSLFEAMGLDPIVPIFETKQDTRALYSKHFNNVILGTADINRNLFITFLLFAKSYLLSSDTNNIIVPDEEFFNGILGDCGWIYIGGNYDNDFDGLISYCLENNKTLKQLNIKDYENLETEREIDINNFDYDFFLDLNYTQRKHDQLVGAIHKKNGRLSEEEKLQKKYEDKQREHDKEATSPIRESAKVDRIKKGR